MNNTSQLSGDYEIIVLEDENFYIYDFDTEIEERSVSKTAFNLVKKELESEGGGFILLEKEITKTGKKVSFIKGLKIPKVTLLSTVTELFDLLKFSGVKLQISSEEYPTAEPKKIEKKADKLSSVIKHAIAKEVSMQIHQAAFGTSANPVAPIEPTEENEIIEPIEDGDLFIDEEITEVDQPVDFNDFATPLGPISSDQTERVVTHSQAVSTAKDLSTEEEPEVMAETDSIPAAEQVFTKMLEEPFQLEQGADEVGFKEEILAVQAEQVSAVKSTTVDLSSEEKPGVVTTDRAVLEKDGSEKAKIEHSGEESANDEELLLGVKGLKNRRGNKRSKGRGRKKRIGRGK